MSRKTSYKVFFIASLCFMTSFFSSFCFASEISFSGGFTKVSLQEGYRTVKLSEGAKVTSDDIELVAGEIDLSGENYRFVDCKGLVKVKEKSKKITIMSPSLSFDRQKNLIVADGWVEVEDLGNEAVLSCGKLEYDNLSQIMKLSMYAKIVKSTDNGLLTCRADSIVYDSKAQTLTLKGSSDIVWGESRYSAAIISVNLETEEIQLYGSISGDVNG